MRSWGLLAGVVALATAAGLLDGLPLTRPDFVPPVGGPTAADVPFARSVRAVADGVRAVEERDHEGALLARGTERRGADGVWRRHGDWVEIEAWDDWYGTASVWEERAGSYADGLREGPWRATDAAGNLVWEGEYEGGERTGPWTWHYPSGAVERRGTFAHDREEGEWTWWWETGGLLKRGAFRDGLDEGPWTFWHENGNRAREGAYERGYPVGTWTIWHVNGERRAEGPYRPDAPDSGTVELHGEVGTSTRQGTWTTWTRDGALESRADWHRGQRHGRAVEWWPSGAVKLTGLWEHGVPYGVHRAQHPDGSHDPDRTTDYGPRPGSPAADAARARREPPPDIHRILTTHDPGVVVGPTFWHCPETDALLEAWPAKGSWWYRREPADPGHCRFEKVGRAEFERRLSEGDG